MKDATKEHVKCTYQLQKSICASIREITSEKQLNLIKVFVEAKKGMN